MSDKIKVELSSQYAEHLELLKQIIPNMKGEQITDDGEMVEALIDSFMAFIQEQAWAHEHSHDEEGGCCWGGSCSSESKEHKHDHWHGGCGCSY